MNKGMFAILVSILSTLSAAAQIMIDPAKAVISVPDRKYEAVAGDLRKHLELITGEKIAVVRDGELPKDRFVFRIGEVPPGEKGPFKPEEARWLATPDSLWFYGDAPNGPSFAVYAFLEDELGVRWPSGNDIAFRTLNPIPVKTLRFSWTPELNIRGIRGTTPGMKEWRTRLRAGAHNPPVYGHAFTDWWKKYGKDHPDYFAMNNGKRQPTTLGQKQSENAAAFTGPMMESIALCVGNEAVAEQIIANWDKKSEYINLCENDAPDELSCHCEKCRALDVLKEGEPFTHNLADRYVNFANRVLAAARKSRPDVKVTMYAYNASQNAPKREKTDPSVVIGIVPTDFTMNALEKYVGDWKKAGMNRFFYRPNRHHYYMLLLPAGHEEYFFRVFQSMYKQGAFGFDYDSPGAATPSDFFSDYVLLKAMQDPSKPFEYWEKHYMQAFAPADKEISDYFRYWREEVWGKRLEKNIAKLSQEGAFYNFGRGLARSLGDYYRESDFDATDKILSQALQRKDLPANVRSRIERLALDNTHARLTFRAIVKKTDEDSIALLKFREKNQYPLFPWSEQYWGDICGLKRVQDLSMFTPPFVRTPVFWFFRLDPADVGMKEEWFKDDYKKIVKWGAYMATNTCWETPHKHYKLISEEIRKKTANYDGVAWYAVPLEKFPLDWKGRKVFLYFGAVDESCKVWVNGKFAGEHPFVKADDWRVSFPIEITDCIDWNRATQIAVVRVEDKSGAGGIWKPVWLVSKTEP